MKWECKLSLEMLKKKFDPVSAPTLVKTKRISRVIKVGKNEDPEIRQTYK